MAAGPGAAARSEILGARSSATLVDAARVGRAALSRTGGGHPLDLDRVAPELRGPMRRAGALKVDNRVLRQVMRGVLAMVPATRVDGVAIERRRHAARGLRLYRPAAVRSSGALLMIHGGGLVIGRPAVNDRLCGEIARDLGVLVVSPEYRKAPEHPFPAALDDVHAAWAWLLREAVALGVDGTRIVVGGESAGGGIAAALAQRLHDEGGPQPIGQLLFCPMLDDRTAARHELDEVRHFVWNNRANRFGWRSYLGVEPGAATVPTYAVAARREDRAGLPPSWIGVGDIELFHDEDAAYAERLRAAGVPVELDVVPGAVHGFETWAADTQLARDHTTRAHAWLRRVVEGSVANSE